MIRTEFESAYASSVATAVAYEMNKRFSPVLSEQMEYFSNAAKTGMYCNHGCEFSARLSALFDRQPSADKISALKGDIEDVKQVPNQA